MVSSVPLVVELRCRAFSGHHPLITWKRCNHHIRFQGYIRPGRRGCVRACARSFLRAIHVSVSELVSASAPPLGRDPGETPSPSCGFVAEQSFGFSAPKEGNIYSENLMAEQSGGSKEWKCPYPECGMGLPGALTGMCPKCGKNVRPGTGAQHSPQSSIEFSMQKTPSVDGVRPIRQEGRDDQGSASSPTPSGNTEASPETVTVAPSTSETSLSVVTGQNLEILTGLSGGISQFPPPSVKTAENGSASEPAVSTKVDQYETAVEETGGPNGNPAEVNSGDESCGSLETNQTEKQLTSQQEKEKKIWETKCKLELQQNSKEEERREKVEEQKGQQMREAERKKKEEHELQQREKEKKNNEKEDIEELQQREGHREQQMREAERKKKEEHELPEAEKKSNENEELQKKEHHQREGHREQHREQQMREAKRKKKEEHELQQREKEKKNNEKELQKKELQQREGHREQQMREAERKKKEEHELQEREAETNENEELQKKEHQQREGHREQHREQQMREAERKKKEEQRKIEVKQRQDERTKKERERKDCREKELQEREEQKQQKKRKLTTEPGGKDPQSESGRRELGNGGGGDGTNRGDESDAHGKGNGAGAEHDGGTGNGDDGDGVSRDASWVNKEKPGVDNPNQTVSDYRYIPGLDAVTILYVKMQ